MKTEIIQINPDHPSKRRLRKAADILKKGGLVAYPTDTVYGLAAAYYNREAVERLYQIKKRPKNKPFPVQVENVKKLKSFNVEISDEAKVLIDKYWPGPATLILKTKNNDRIGFRIPADKIARELLKETGFPLCVPSANYSGEAPPKVAKDVIISFDGIIEAIIDGGRCPGGVESTVVDLTSSPYRVLREGALSIEELRETLKNKDKFVKVKNILFVCTGNSCRSVMAKGLLEKEKRGSADLKVMSAGTAAFSGLSPTKETIEIMLKEGIDTSGNKTQGVSSSLVNRADLILAMEPKHKHFLIERYPQAKNKVFLLKEYKNENVREPSIKDPIGQPMEVYREVLEEIKKEIERIKDLI
jgi:tRNA threonylcarbamoyl adenosine modification protein (Sua5/YciO/YrdC/YwlC family)